MLQLDVYVGDTIKQAESMLYRYERQVLPKAVSSAINKTANNVQTAVNSHISKATGLKVKEIKKAQWRIRSTQYTFYATITNRRRSFNLIRFVTPGKRKVGAFRNQQGVTANPWRDRKVFKGAFIARGRTHGKLIVMARTTKERTPLKGLYGPSLHVEFARPAVKRLANATIAIRFPINFDRDLNYYVSRIRP